MFFSASGCRADNTLVSDVHNSRNKKDFFGDSNRRNMEKVFLQAGKGYYIRAEGYSTSRWADGFLNIGVLYHSANGLNQEAMTYQYETQEISILDKAKDEIQEIAFDSISPDTRFKLIMDDIETTEFSGASTASDISESLNQLSAKGSKSLYYGSYYLYFPAV